MEKITLILHIPKHDLHLLLFTRNSLLRRKHESFRPQIRPKYASFLRCKCTANASQTCPLCAAKAPTTGPFNAAKVHERRPFNKQK